MSESKEWKYAGKIEEMSDKELKRRIQDAMDFEIKNKIRPIPYLGGEKLTIEYSYPELQARCPMTGLKDIYKVRMKFVPNKLIPELKSLQFYFYGYEDLSISHEHIIAKIYKDFKKTVAPEKMAIVLYVATRGEVVTTVALGDEDLLGFTRPDKEDNFAR